MAGSRPCVHSRLGQPPNTCQPTPVRHLVRLPNGKAVGYHDGSTFYRTLQPQHFTTVPHGVAVAVEVLEGLRAAGVTWVHFESAADGTTYLAPLEAFFRYGLPIQRGYGPQLLLEVRQFFTVAVGQLPLPLEEFVGGGV